MHNYHVDSFSENCWCDLIDYSSLLDDAAPPPDFFEPPPENVGNGMSIDISLIEITAGVIKCEERGSLRKRGRSDIPGGTKACREKERRGKLNDRFLELSAILEPGRSVKTEKQAILGDAIRLINELKAESKEYTEMNKRLMEEIQTLKVEKNELREEKLKLKTDKYMMEQQLKTLNIPPIYGAEVNKVPMLPSYGFVPMWQYLPPSIRDTSQDDKLRPPAA
ncbi:basic helix-loop-helix DNA-binding superfamily protein [Perilla frutescens var. hirtella]|nr:basic helix-loop-helix DNA-binding superfamily protein [Perilla frutescens var. hirtella]